MHAVFVFGLFFNLEDEGDISPEILIDFQRTTRRYIPEDTNLHLGTCLNLFFPVSTMRLIENQYLLLPFTSQWLLYNYMYRLL
jgi:hypothetical protein